MPSIHCPVDDAIVVAVDIQPTFMAAIHEPERVVARSRFLLSVAKLLELPILATEQYPTRMGALDERLVPLLPFAPMPKMAFSCWGAEGFQDAIEASGRANVVLVGIETHICVTLTALDLLKNGYGVFVCPDAVSSRTLEQHKLGMERMRDSGAIASHTETLAYEWMGTAANPVFREVLPLVKGT